MNVRVEIRKAVPDDAKAISSVLAEAFTEYKPLYTEKGFTVTTPPCEEIEKRFSEGLILVALLNGDVVGAVSAVPRGKDLYIRSMAILPKARGQKIGEKLLLQIEDFAFSNNFKRLTLSTTPFLHRAIRLYEKFGFAHEGIDDLFGTPLITMEKRLN